MGSVVVPRLRGMHWEGRGLAEAGGARLPCASDSLEGSTPPNRIWLARGGDTVRKGYVETLRGTVGM